MVENKEHQNKAVSRWPGFLICLMAIVFFAHELSLHENTGEKKWDAALTHLNAEVLPEDGLLVSPPWHSYPGKELEEILIKSGHDGHILHTSPLTELDISRFPRIWVLSPTKEDIPPLLSSCQFIEGISPVSLCLWQRTIRPPVFDFIARLNAAKVHRIGKRKNKINCTWKKDRHRCKTSKRMYDIRAFVGEVGDTRRKAIFAHPYPSDGQLNIRYPKSTRGETLTISYGNALRGVRMKQGSPVEFRVFVDDELLHESTVPIDDFSWNTVELRIPSGEKKCEYRFEITASNSSWRHFFFDGAAF